MVCVISLLKEPISFVSSKVVVSFEAGRENGCCTDLVTVRARSWVSVCGGCSSVGLVFFFD